MVDGDSLLSTLPSFENHSNQQTVTSTCYMCACRCGIKVTVEDNKIRFIQGNREHPVNKGVLCAKGNAGIMKQISPAKLCSPLLRKKDAKRGESSFEEISWEQAMDILTERLQKIRNDDPNKLAFFTGRDQMQALSGLWATEFGTMNWAAHGGFCSVDMAAAGLYTHGFSFWEFSEPDWENTRYFMLWGVAEDHASNPIKLGLQKLKRNGGKFIAINPVQTGYQSIADEWIAIKPGTDGALALAIVHLLLKRQKIDMQFLLRYTNASGLLIENHGGDDDGLFYRNDQDELQQWCELSKQAVPLYQATKPALFGRYQAEDGSSLVTVMTLLAEKYLQPRYAPEEAAKITGLSVGLINRLASELAAAAFDEAFELPIKWQDCAGNHHEKVVGRPVSFHAMRGISAHSNGFQTCRALHLLQALLGAIDAPGSHLAKPPYPRSTPPPIKPAKHRAANTPLSSSPLGFPQGPEDLAIDDQGRPLRLDKAFSWEAPLAVHGMMHTVIRNAYQKDPYPIDTLMLFMANLAWNSSMNSNTMRDYLSAQESDGSYTIPFLVVVDAFHSEMVNYADLVLPDTTYLERFDAISLLDRPISEANAVCDAIRQPVLQPDRNVRPWQDVLLELANNLRFAKFVDKNGAARYKDYKDFIAHHEVAPGIGFLAGWRGKKGEKSIRGESNSHQWERYQENGCFFSHTLPPEHQYYRFANQGYLDWAKDVGFVGTNNQIVIQIYSEPLQRFNLAALGQTIGPMPVAEKDKQRIIKNFQPLPEYRPCTQRLAKNQFHALTQRPMFMYHSWDSQNAWLRQICTQNYLYMNRARALAMGIEDLGYARVASKLHAIVVQVKHMEGVQSDTVWTWNAIGKQRGNWGLSKNAPESNTGFLLNALIDDQNNEDSSYSNSDPITGQAAWYDLIVDISPATASEMEKQSVVAACLPSLQPGGEQSISYQSHSAIGITRNWRDLFFR